jgi:Domain of unknown function DUF29
MSDYDTDFYAWTQAQAAALRAKEWKTLDVENLAEEIESLGNEQEHAVRSHLRNLLLHLLKCAYLPPPRRSWVRSILNARDEIDWRLLKNRSLQPILPELFASAYPRARRLAATDTGLPLATFPETCPWSIEQVLDEDFWPEEAR